MFSANHKIGGLGRVLDDGWFWMMDNNAFGNNFNFDNWINMIDKFSVYRQTCLGIPAPDVVGNCNQTIKLFWEHKSIIKDYGLTVAFVTQDGLTPQLTPWAEFDTLFIGGSDSHKLGAEAGLLISAARENGKHVHIGRVNSQRRLEEKFWMADSVDGTMLIKAKRIRSDYKDKRSYLTEVKRLYYTVQFCRDKKAQRTLL